VTNKLTPQHLQRRAIVYVRQSSLIQVLQNRESQLRQYNLAGYTRKLGFVDVETIDEDLGRSASGLVERPGFQRLVTEICEGQIGAVFCLEASRLARNGRDWHHLIELCGLVGAVLIDLEGIYDPRLINDRLVLGLRGTRSEFELGILRQRSVEAIRQKAQRGELRFCLPVGLGWSTAGNMELNPDGRVQNAIHLVFRKFQELGSARQVLLWCREQQITLPALGYSEGAAHVYWKVPIYSSILAILENPLYTGAYAFGKTEARTKVVAGRPQKTSGLPKPREQWTVLIRDHHPGYIFLGAIGTEPKDTGRKCSYEIAPGTTEWKGRPEPVGGPALVPPLRMLQVHYGRRGIRYRCVSGNIKQGLPICISFGQVRVDQAVSMEGLQAIQPLAIEAALEAPISCNDGRMRVRGPCNWNWSRPATKRVWQHAGTRLSIPYVFFAVMWRSRRRCSFGGPCPRFHGHITTGT
jgi:DNA invertase Pin-like site-specific DNA recombinase